MSARAAEAPSATERKLDLALAFERVRDELRARPRTARALAHNPFEVELIELDLDSWIQALGSRIERDEYVPGPIEVCDYPKGSDLVRPGSRLSIEDRVAITAAVGSCLHPIDQATRWSQGSCDFAARLDPAQLDSRSWFRNPFKGWKEFHDRSLQRLDSASFDYVLSADIAGFFENINIGLLRSDLLRIGCPQNEIALIGNCLNQWSQCPDRGLPQGLLASDVLAKLYLEPFDERLRQAGFVHLRYTDDLRVFTRTRGEAQRALVFVSQILRERGLTLQSSKTQIRRAEEARSDFDGILPAIEGIRREYIDEVVAMGLMSSDVSLPMGDIDSLAGEAEIEPAVLHRAFDAFVAQRAHPNRSMLNFILRRLGKQRDNFAVPECAERLVTQPEFTPSITLYLQELGEPDDVEHVVMAALSQETSAIYPYQRFLLLDWLSRNATSLSEECVSLLRQLATRPESPRYVQALAWELLGRHGTHSDIDEIVARYRSATDPFVRAQFLCCLSRLERSRRNGLASRVMKDPGWVGRAARLVRE